MERFECDVSLVLWGEVWCFCSLPDIWSAHKTTGMSFWRERWAVWNAFGVKTMCAPMFVTLFPFQLYVLMLYVCFFYIQQIFYPVESEVWEVVLYTVAGTVCSDLWSVLDFTYCKWRIVQTTPAGQHLVICKHLTRQCLNTLKKLFKTSLRCRYGTVDDRSQKYCIVNKVSSCQKNVNSPVIFCLRHNHMKHTTDISSKQQNKRGFCTIPFPPVNKYV